MQETNQINAKTSTDFVCPLCRKPLIQYTESYQCTHCQRDYPILFGIADFRLRSDPYLSLEEERAKAKRLVTEVKQDFSSMLDYYYEITDDVPPALATRYKAYQQNGPKQARHSLVSLSLSANDTVLDAGCGTGGALIAAAENCSQLYGIDIALRWLVICQQRLKEQGVTATLVCADIESPPFADQRFSKIIATDLLENVYSVEKTLSTLSQLLTIKGKLWVAGSNKFCLGPHPTTRLWAIGYFPIAVRKRLLHFFRGVDSLRFINLISPQFVVDFSKQIGLHALVLRPRMVTMDSNNTYPLIDRILIKIYSIITRMPLFSQLMVQVGPAFELILTKSARHIEQKETKIS